ncbi:hypothetical protein FisN_25Lh155 [Fistulifera solaris]|uniref:Uncharacterized protein n=1 Tax=Fistulifera solaris TaxID=1519565 RepID=A0A1Z5KS83_FISSO|nr:hypothetical protein FisN_25Lh155 [Fistulifera solaris]|eukprot:GAX28788.1 hypothetical protein FisN_25Lh155 [Fistulifera solaris]
MPNTSFDTYDDSKRDDFFDLDGDDFIMRFMDSTCQGFMPRDQEASCLPACNTVGLEQQLEMLTHCRRPLDFLSFFQEQCTAEEDPPAIPGVYMTPKDCEYCGATQTKDCDPQTCTRPVLYFQKKRPPFCKPESSKWDPTNDHAIVERRRNSLSAEIKNEDGETDTVLSGRSYFGSFF